MELPTGAPADGKEAPVIAAAAAGARKRRLAVVDDHTALAKQVYKRWLSETSDLVKPVVCATGRLARPARAMHPNPTLSVSRALAVCAAPRRLRSCPAPSTPWQTCSSSRTARRQPAAATGSNSQRSPVR